MRTPRVINSFVVPAGTTSERLATPCVCDAKESRNDQAPAELSFQLNWSPFPVQGND